MIRLEAKPEAMSGSSQAAKGHKRRHNPFSVIGRTMSKNMPLSRHSSKSSYHQVDAWNTAADGDFSDEDGPRPHRPLVKTCSGGSSKKLFTVVNYGQVEAGDYSGRETERSDNRRGSFIQFSANLPPSRKSSTTDFSVIPVAESSVSLHAFDHGEPSLATISNIDLRRPSLGNEPFLGTNNQQPENSSHGRRQHFAPDVYSRLEHRRHSLAPSLARRASHTPTIAEFEYEDDDECDTDSVGIRGKNGTFLNGNLGQFLPQAYTVDKDIEKGKTEQNFKQKGWNTSFPLINVARRGRLYAKRKKFRVVSKQGDCNVQYFNVDRRGFVAFHDIFTTVLNLKWRYNILLFILIFTISWVLFALLWWVIAFMHYNPISDENECVTGVNGFVSALLFSIETQQTIGYGTRATTPSCFGAVTLMTIQTLFGVFIQCVVTGVIFAKVARPKRRAGAFIFSHNAVIYKNDGHLSLIFRVGDTRRSQMMGVSVNALLVTSKITEEGELINRHQVPLKVSTESDSQFYFLAWPIKVVHRINQDSPLWCLSAEELLLQDFEIIFILEATCETTGMTTQVRTSYLPSEILWGYRLAPLNTQRNNVGNFLIDFARFNDTIPDDTPEYSAKEQHDMNLKTVSRFSHLSTIAFENEMLRCEETSQDNPK